MFPSEEVKEAVRDPEVAMEDLGGMEGLEETEDLRQRADWGHLLFAVHLDGGAVEVEDQT